MNRRKRNVTVLGGGSWATAVASIPAEVHREAW
jgi:hypothetical protein